MKTDRARLYAELARLVPGRARWDQPLRECSHWRIGGPADLIVEPATVQEVQQVRALLHQSGVPSIIIGDATNLLFDDAGFRGVVIRIGPALAGIDIGASGRVRAGAGWWVPWLVRKLIAAGLSGAVHAIGIPARLGGLVAMNGGSQRRSIGEHVRSVDVVGVDGTLRRLTHEQCGFAYRSSAIQQLEVAVVQVEFQFERGDSAALRRQALGILAQRRRKFPLKQPNAGSVFLSEPELYERHGPPGKVIEAVGLKGMRRGDAMVSHRHANFIVNLGQARSKDVLQLIGLVRSRVHSATGFWLSCEVRHVSPDGRLRPAHLAAEELDE